MATGRRIVDLIREGGQTPRQILTRTAFENAIKTLAAIGGSTNALIHLLAVARRTGVGLSLQDFDTVAAEVPPLVDLKPSGQLYMEDLHRSGGVPAVLKQLEQRLDTSTVGVSGHPLAESLSQVPDHQDWQSAVHPLEEPLGPPGALAVLKGSLAPDGAIIKSSAASAHLMQHTGPALVLDLNQDIAAVLDDPDLNVTADHVLVLRNAGPVAAGMPEAGALPIPAKLAQAGVHDMVRISDARMSGTSYGTVVLHSAPEAAAGGPLAAVRDGDLIRLDVPDRRLDILVDDAELERRLATLSPPDLPERGWRRLYAKSVLPASQGADLDFL